MRKREGRTLLTSSRLSSKEKTRRSAVSRSFSKKRESFRTVSSEYKLVRLGVPDSGLNESDKSKKAESVRVSPFPLPLRTHLMGERVGSVLGDDLDTDKEVKRAGMRNSVGKRRRGTKDERWRVTKERQKVRMERLERGLIRICGAVDGRNPKGSLVSSDVSRGVGER